MKKKIIIFLLVLFILLGIYMLYNTFAVSSIASNITDNVYDIDINDSSTITIPKNSSKTIYYHIKNTNKGAIKYGVGYNTSSNIEVFIYEDSIDKASDTISYGYNKYIKLYLSNSTDTDSSVTISTMLGYENGGELIVDDGITLVTEVYTKPRPQIKLADYITDLYTSASKSTVTNNSITYNYATSVNLMNDRLGGTTTSLDEGNIRYYGASPNNYIYFNCSDYSNQTSDTCELWRIIGVFDGKVKIIRNSTIGTYSWDSSASDVNSGYGVNEWSQADLMKLLNPGYENESVGGSLYYNGESGTCYSGSSNQATKSCDFTSIGLKNDETRNMIAKGVTWNTGGWNSNKVYSNAMYGYERGTAVYSGSSDGITRNATWTSEKQTIALAYFSDYGYAVDFNSCSKTISDYDDSTCTSTNWMKSILGTSSCGWLLTPYSRAASNVWYVLSSGSVTYNFYSFGADDVAPTLFLSSTQTIYEDNSNGSSNSPYQLSVN